MARRFLVIIAATALLATPALAVTISLPGLTGGYEYDATVAPDFGFPATRTITFDMPADLATIDHMALVVSGTWHHGAIQCTGEPEPSPWSSPMGVYLFSDEFSGGYIATVDVPDDEFTDLTGPFTTVFVPDFIPLIGATVQAQMYPDAALIGICWLTLDPYGEFTDVRLEITGTVATERSTLSNVKALYR